MEEHAHAGAGARRYAQLLRLGRRWRVGIHLPLEGQKSGAARRRRFSGGPRHDRARTRRSTPARSNVRCRPCSKFEWLTLLSGSEAKPTPGGRPAYDLDDPAKLAALVFENCAFRAEVAEFPRIRAVAGWAPPSATPRILANSATRNFEGPGEGPPQPPVRRAIGGRGPVLPAQGQLPGVESG